MTKPTIYLDSNIFSALHYYGRIDENISRQNRTEDWWNLERKHFSLFTSGETESELRRGKYSGQRAAIAEALRLPFLPYDKEVVVLADLYLSKALIPKSKYVDAMQLAFSVKYGIDYLMSWNYAHLVSAEVQVKLVKLSEQSMRRIPILVSPDSIPRASLGQAIRRRD